MSLHRENLYKYPWSKTDNPGAWVEVTDECDMVCPGCYRHKLEGHKPLEDVKREILFSRDMTNCERIAIAGGEPLIYPHILDAIEFIARHNMKPMILSNGVKFDRTFGTELKKAGLAQIYFHVDSGQKRPGWEGKNEDELNALRQHYADLVYELDGMQCGFNITVFRSTLKDIPKIVAWSQANIHKVQFLSLICFRGLLDAEGIEYMADGQPLDLSQLQTLIRDPEEITLSNEEMYELLEEHFPELRASAYLGGTTIPMTYKFLILLPFGSETTIYGVIGARTAELAQSLYHLVKGSYNASLKSPKIGKKVFLLSVLDREVRQAFGHFLKACLKNPLRFFDKIYVQCINLQQPNETINGEKNLCDGCMNLMAYNGKMIHSCTLDEYRMFGGPIEQIITEKEER